MPTIHMLIKIIPQPKFRCITTSSAPICRMQLHNCKNPTKKDKFCSKPPRHKDVANDPYRINRPNVTLKPMPICNVKPALNCKAPKLAEPCTERKLIPKAAPPPPPRTPFPWIYLLALAFLFGSCGIVYQLYERKVRRRLLLEAKTDWKPRKIKKIPHKFYNLPKEVQYLIIGAGAAGMAAYNAIKEHDKTAKVMLISDEDIEPYMRTGLSKELWTIPHFPDTKTLAFMQGKQEYSLFYLDASEYIHPTEFAKVEEGPAVSVASGWTVVSVDPEEHIVYVATRLGNYPIKYKKCLIAAGSEPKDLHLFKIAPHEVNERVCRLRRIRDLETAWHSVRQASKIIVIGDGPLACELTYAMKHLDDYVKREAEEDSIEVTQIVKRSGVLSKILPDYLGRWAAEMIKADGVKLLTNLEVYDSYLTDKDELKIFLSNGEEIPADYIFLAVGVTPRTDLAERSLLEVDNKLGGYVVNPELLARTDLYVAGDCACFYDVNGDDRKRIEHYNSAVDMGCHAGENMVGNMKAFVKPCTFTVKFGKNIIMQAFGETKSSMATVGVFTTCTVEQNLKDSKKTAVENDLASGENANTDMSEEYKKKFEKGVIFYLKDTEDITGMVLWNMEGKDDIALEILTNKPTYDGINSFVKTLGLHEEDCCEQTAET